MSNFLADIEDCLEGEEVQGVVIGQMGWGDYGSEDVPQYSQQPKGKLLTWAEAAPLLEYPYSTGHGAPECNAIYVWTPTRVLFVSQYDGSTSIESVPRHPIDTMPNMPGG